MEEGASFGSRKKKVMVGEEGGLRTSLPPAGWCWGCVLPWWEWNWINALAFSLCLSWSFFSVLSGAGGPRRGHARARHWVATLGSAAQRSWALGKAGHPAVSRLPRLGWWRPQSC